MAKKSIAIPDQSKGYKPVLLLVDDDPLIAESLSLALEDDYQVIVAESRVQAKTLLQK